MKRFIQPRSPILKENSVDTPPSNPTSNKQSKSSGRKHKSPKENAPPSDPNAIPDSSPSPSCKQSPAAACKLKSPLPPRPPPSNSHKRKLSNDFLLENGVAGSSDTGVQVIVRIRPPSRNEDEGEDIVQKTSNDSLSILGQTFTFDSVADTASTQVDIFQLVGAPLVENCIAGFNSSVFAYGQTGSGKTYTIWGPSNALLEDESSSDQQGLTPRVFERLFSRINEEQNKHADKQLMYQCRCSFLEIYNEQITDLLDPTQRNLQIREDTKTGVYVENLTEESVSSIKDVTQLLKKGLSNRRTGATSINMESSRSHSVFTCVVESRCKSMDGLSSLKTSRINLVDLAGSERQKSTGAAGERLKEAGNINRSLSQLGNLINILAEVSQTGKQRHIPYRDSKLTFLLQESLGGNAKLAMVCAISPAQSCKSETFSTLRFAKRAKAIKNKAVVNEQMQDDVNTLREVIRQLKDELVRMKENTNKNDPSGNYSTGWNARRSLNLLKYSLNRPMVLPCMNEDEDEEMEIVEEAEQVLEASKECENMEADNIETNSQVSNDTSNLTILPSEVSPVLKLTPSVSPRTNSSSRKSLTTSQNALGNSISESMMVCHGQSQTDRLAASLHHGLEVIDRNRKSFALGRSSFRFPLTPIKKDVGVQAFSLEESMEFLCSNCKSKRTQVVQKEDTHEHEHEHENDPSNMQLVPVNESPLVDNNKQLVPKAVEKVLAGAIRREMTLEEFCTKQNTEIMQLNRLVQQYKHERECNSIIAQLQEDKITRLENLMDGVLSNQDFSNQELTSLTNQHQILKEKYENHPEVLRKEIELKSVQEELERYRSFYEMGERDVLLEEIQDLRNQLQSYIDSSRKQSPVLQITYPVESVEKSNMESSDEGRIEMERIKFKEEENKWISYTEELKSQLEESQLVNKRQKEEVERERKCTEELKEAMGMAMEGHARILEQYADLEEKHINMLIRQRRIQDGIEDVKKGASKAGVRESKYVNALAVEISTLKVERERERGRFRDEIKGLQEQLRDTAEAVQAAGELLVRLKEAEENVAFAKAQARKAEQETENAYKQIKKLKKKHNIDSLEESNYKVDQQLKDGFDQFYNVDNKEELTTLPEFSGYDRCNV